MAAQRQRQQPLERPMEMLRLLDGGPLVADPNGGGAATAAAAAGAADGDAEAAGRRTTGTIHDFRRNG